MKRNYRGFTSTRLVYDWKYLKNENVSIIDTYYVLLSAITITTYLHGTVFLFIQRSICNYIIF